VRKRVFARQKSGHRQTNERGKELTTSPSNTTFSPRTKKTPLSV